MEADFLLRERTYGEIEKAILFANKSSSICNIITDYLLSEKKWLSNRVKTLARKLTRPKEKELCKTDRVVSETVLVRISVLFRISWDFWSIKSVRCKRILKDM